MIRKRNFTINECFLVFRISSNREATLWGGECQCKFNTNLSRVLWIGWRGRWEGRSGWGTHVNPWLIHFNVWQNPLQKKKRVLWSPLPCPMWDGLPAIMTKPHTQCLMKEVSPLHSHVEEGGVWAWNFAPESMGAGGTPLLSGFSVCKGEGAEFQTGGWFEVGDDAPTGPVKVGWHWVSRWGGLYLPQIPLLWMKGRQALGKNQKRGVSASVTHSFFK